MKFKILIVLLLLSLASTACALSVSKTGKAETVKTPEILFKDDFSNTDSGWDRREESGGLTDYQDGQYKIQVNDSNYYLWANPGKTFTDVIVDVDARVIQDKGGDVGIICRYKDLNNFYFLRITSDGYFGISKMVDGSENLLGTSELPSSEKIKTGKAANHLTAICSGDHLTLKVNGEVLADVQDSDLTGGDIGLIAGTFDDGGNEVLFDNLSATRP